jgi:hypothetical protein
MVNMGWSPHFALISSESPAQRPVQAGAQKAISYQYQYQFNPSHGAYLQTTFRFARSIRMPLELR